MPQFQFQPSLESLECRRLLAGDVSPTAEDVFASEIAEIISADVNSDGRVSAKDALTVINQLNLGEPASSVIDRVIGVLDVNGDGDVSAVDALRIVNRLNSSQTDLVDSVFASMPSLRSVFSDDSPIGDRLLSSETADGIRTSISDLVQQANALRQSTNLDGEAIAGLINEITQFVSEANLPTRASIETLESTWSSVIDDSEISSEDIAQLRGSLSEVLASTGVSAQRANGLLDRIEDIVVATDLDSVNFGSVWQSVQAIVNSLPQSLSDRLEELDLPIQQAAESLTDLIEDGFSLGGLNDIITDLRGLQVDLSLPSFASITNFVADYRDATDDGAFTEGELTTLRESAGDVLSSAGIDGDLFDSLLRGFDTVIRFRFQNS